jgi:hypothetical protein
VAATQLAPTGSKSPTQKVLLLVLLTPPPPLLLPSL